jgi:hypothetical protein
MNAFKTPKGTNLPLLDLRGKDYLQVAHRLVWFREERPTWGIETEFVSITDRIATVKAVIRDEAGRVIATAHKTEDKAGFPDFMEKAETGAIGRALALIGYGTQFCSDELDEGQRLADSPTLRVVAQTTVSPHAYGVPEPTPEQAQRDADRGYRINFGKWNRKSIEEVYNGEGEEKMLSYIDWLQENAAKTGKPVSPDALRFIHEVKQFLRAMNGASEEGEESEVPF